MDLQHTLCQVVLNNFLRVWHFRRFPFIIRVSLFRFIGLPFNVTRKENRDGSPQSTRPHNIAGCELTKEKFPSKFGKRLNAVELKQFRSYVSQLKKKGLIKKGISARSARPVMISNGKTLQEIVNKSLKTIPPIQPTARLLPLKTPYTLRNVPGIQNKSLAAIFNEIERNPELASQINAMKLPGERFAFQIDGMPSMHAYVDIEQLIEDAFKYTDDRAGFSIYSKRQKSRVLGEKLKIVRWNGPAFSYDTFRTPRAVKAAKKLKRNKKRSNKRRK